MLSDSPDARRPVARPPHAAVLAPNAAPLEPKVRRAVLSLFGAADGAGRQG